MTPTTGTGLAHALSIEDCQTVESSDKDSAGLGQTSTGSKIQRRNRPLSCLTLLSSGWSVHGDAATLWLRMDDQIRQLMLKRLRGDEEKEGDGGKLPILEGGGMTRSG